MSTKNFRAGFISVAVACAWTFGAFASTTTPLVSSEEYSVGQGDIQTYFNLSPQIYAGDSTGHVIDIGIGANYFWTDILAPGVSFRMVSIDNFGTVAQFLPNIKAYYPLHQRLLPYAMAGLGYAHFPGADLFNMGVGFGADYLLSNTVAFGVQFRYDLGVGDGTHHLIAFPLGFALYFKL